MLLQSPWISMSLHKSPWVSVSLYESPWVSMSLHESPWVSMSLHESLWVSMSLLESPWVSISLYESPSTKNEPLYYSVKKRFHPEIWGNESKFTWFKRISSSIFNIKLGSLHYHIGLTHTKNTKFSKKLGLLVWWWQFTFLDYNMGE